MTPERWLYLGEWIVALALYAILGAGAYYARYRRVLQPRYWLIGVRAAIFGLQEDRWERHGDRRG